MQKIGCLFQGGCAMRDHHALGGMGTAEQGVDPLGEL
jgi:hypothetical protein